MPRFTKIAKAQWISRNINWLRPNNSVGPSNYIWFESASNIPTSGNDTLILEPLIMIPLAGSRPKADLSILMDVRKVITNHWEPGSPAFFHLPSRPIFGLITALIGLYLTIQPI